MNCKKTLTKVASAIMAGLMVVPSTVFADEVKYTATNATIDTTKKGSITLYKYVDNNGNTVDASGISYAGTSTDMLAAVRQQVGDNDIFPEKGVKFKAVKVADIEQVTENTTNGISVTGTYYTNIDEGFFDIMNKYLGDEKLTASESTRVTDKRTTDDASEVDDHYESDEFNEKLQTVNRAAALADGSESVTGEVALNRYLRQMNSAIAFDETDENGYTKIENLELGLYLICEVDYQHSALSKHDTYWERVDDSNDDLLTGDIGDTEDAGNEESGLTAGGNNAGGSQYADIASPSSPFFISIPMTNLDTITDENGDSWSAGTAWQYDIIAYPKNGTINIHKDIVTNDFAGTTNSGNDASGKTANDGVDISTDKTLCNMVQTNFLPDDGTSDKVDGSEKSGLTHQIDANIGDTITQLISVDVPRLTDDLDNEQEADAANSTTTTRKHNKTFKITDRMTKGLKLTSEYSFKVTLTTGAWNDYGENTTEFIKDQDYTLEFAEDKQSYVLTITETGLAKMDDIKAASYLYILYDVELTKDALIGTDTYGNQRVTTKDAASTETNVKEGNLADQLVVDTTKEDTTYTNADGVSHPEAGNQNTAELTYATDRTMEHDYYSNTTRVYTYEIDLTKLFTDGTAGYVSKNATNEEKTSASFDYSAVKFSVKGYVSENSEHSKDGKGTEQLQFIRTGDGTYRVYDPATDDVTIPDDYVDSIDQPADEKTVTIYVTPNSKTGLLTIKGLDARTYEFTEVATAKGRNLMASPFCVSIVAPVVDGKTLEDGSVEHAYLWTETKVIGDLKTDHDLAAYDVNLTRMNEGRIPFTVQNNEVIKVLKTGGTGTLVAMCLGGGIMFIGIGAAIIKRKKDEEEQEPSSEA